MLVRRNEAWWVLHRRQWVKCTRKTYKISSRWNLKLKDSVKIDHNHLRWLIGFRMPSSGNWRPPRALAGKKRAESLTTSSNRTKGRGTNKSWVYFVQNPSFVRKLVDSVPPISKSCPHSIVLVRRQRARWVVCRWWCVNRRSHSTALIRRRSMYPSGSQPLSERWMTLRQRSTPTNYRRWNSILKAPNSC